MKEQWNERYAASEYIYGISPNRWFAEKLSLLQPGKLLLPAEGEGRNAVYAANEGWEVLAFDQSEEGQKKAIKLASAQNVTINYSLGDLVEFEPPQNNYDAVALIFVHMPVEIRQDVHRKLIEKLKPGGYLILEAFTKKQMQNTSGGPRTETLLYEREFIANDFKDLNILEFEETIASLDEGTLHRGEAFVIRLLAQKSEN
ncbi:MAG: class I SAM-dependent methyltransferase [Lentimicrobium sp.]